MAYTVTATELTITDEGTEANPISMADLLANAPSVVSEQADGSFYVSVNPIFQNSHFKDTSKSIFFNLAGASVGFSISTDSTIIFGDIDANENTFGGCYVVFLSAPFNMFSGGGLSGDMKGYSTLFETRTNGSAFWRLYRGDNQITTFIDCIFNGYSGTGRLQGTILRDCVFTDGSGVLGPFTTRLPTYEISGVTIKKCDQWFYWNGSLSGSVVLRNIRERDNNNSQLRITDPANGATMTLIDCDFENETLAFTGNALPSSASMSILEYYSYNASVVLDSDSSNVIGTRLAFFQVDGTEEYNEVSDSSGLFTEALLLKYLYESDTPVLKTPHTMRVRKIGFEYIEIPVNSNSAVVNQFRLNVDDRVVNPIDNADINFDFVNKSVTLLNMFTIQEIFDSYMYQLSQETNMQYAEEWDLVLGVLKLGDWTLDLNGENINGSVTGKVIITDAGQITNGDYTQVEYEGTETELTFTDVNIDTFDNYSGLDVNVYLNNSTINNPLETDGAILFPAFLTLTSNVDGDFATVIRNAETGDIIYPRTETTIHSVSVDGVNSVVISAFKEGYWLESEVVAISGNTDYNINLREAIFYNSELDVMYLKDNISSTVVLEPYGATSPITALVEAEFLTDIGDRVPQGHMRQVLLDLHGTSPFIELINAVGRNGDEIISSDLYGFSILQPVIHLTTAGNFNVELDDFVNDLGAEWMGGVEPNFIYNPENTDNRKVNGSPYELILQSNIASDGGTTVDLTEIETKLLEIETKVDAIPTTDSITDLTPVLTAIADLNDPTEEEIRDTLLLVADSFKADVSGISVDLQPVLDAIDNLNDPTEEEIRDTLLLVADSFKATSVGGISPQDLLNLKNHITAMNFAS